MEDHLKLANKLLKYKYMLGIETGKMSDVEFFLLLMLLQVDKEDEEDQAVSVLWQ
jgi:hypothetical protein